MRACTDALPKDATGKRLEGHHVFVYDVFLDKTNSHGQKLFPVYVNSSHAPLSAVREKARALASPPRPRRAADARCTRHRMAGYWPHSSLCWSSRRTTRAQPL